MWAPNEFPIDIRPLRADINLVQPILSRSQIIPSVGQRLKRVPREDPRGASFVSTFNGRTSAVNTKQKLPD
jgi:hypothetical protein